MTVIIMRQVRIILFVLLLTGCEAAHVPAPFQDYGLKGGASSAGMHTVSAGDTVWEVAERYNLSMQDIIYVNKIGPPYVLMAGDRLFLPPPNTYEVRHGDTLYSISRTFDVSMTELARLNHMDAPYVVRPRMELQIPSVKHTYQPQPVDDYGQANSSPKSLAPVRVVRRALDKETPKRAGKNFSWPIDGPVISSYGPKEGGLHNDGVNISAPRGTPVKVAENGIVVYADNQLKGFGNLVLVRHDNNWVTAYAHLDNVDITRGQEVKIGQVIGGVGSTGSVDSPQLHFEVRRGTEAKDPAAWLARRGS